MITYHVNASGETTLPNGDLLTLHSTAEFVSDQNDPQFVDIDVSQIQINEKGSASIEAAIPIRTPTAKVATPSMTVAGPNSSM